MSDGIGWEFFVWWWMQVCGGGGCRSVVVLVDAGVWWGGMYGEGCRCMETGVVSVAGELCRRRRRRRTECV